MCNSDTKKMKIFYFGITLKKRAEKLGKLVAQQRILTVR